MPRFVGRSAELAALASALDDARDGRGRVLFLVGEPGIGKTRLADEFCARAGERARFLWGRCWEAGGAPAFWPWIEVLRPLVAEGDPLALASELGSDAVLVAALLPEVRHRLPGLPAESPGSSDHARFLLFDAVARFLRARALAAPLVLVLDDLHAADEPSLRLLEFVTRGLRGSRLLVVATYRDADARLVPETARLLATVERDAERFSLRRLRPNEVAELLESSAGIAPTAAVLDAVVRVTEGTPLFVNEVARLVEAHGPHAISTPTGKIVVPDGLGPAIRGHLARVSDETRATLRVAAVIGRDFSLPLLLLLHGERDGSPEQVVQRLVEAERARLIVDVRDEPPRFRFSHILVRETIYQDLGTDGRERMHGEVARAIAARAAGGAEVGHTFAEIAHHFLRAGPAGAERAVEYARRAGEHALGLSAHEQARTHFEQALGALDENHPDRERTRAELLLALSDAYLRGGERARSCKASEEAAAAAERLGDGRLLARAALQRGAEFTFGAVDSVLAALLEKALEHLQEDRETALTARLMARLAAARQPAPVPEEPIALAQQAIALARRAGDRAALAMVIRDARAAYLPMDSLEERLALDLEALSLAYETGDRLGAIHAQRRLSVDRLEEGEIAAGLGHIEQYERLADEMREPHRRWWSSAARAMLCMMRGAFAEAEQLLAQADALADNDPGARDTIGMHRLALVWTARRDGELAMIDSTLAREFAARLIPETAVFRAVVRGRMGDAAFVADFLKTPHPRATHPRMGGKSFLAELAVVLGDRARAAACYELLLPWEKRYIVPFGFEGSYARILGLLASTLGHIDSARLHFEEAIERNERIGARPWVAHTLIAYADMLLAAGDQRDRGKAAELRRRALSIARELRMPGILARVEAILAPESEAAEGEPLPHAPTDRSVAFRLEGEYWTVSFRGQSFRLKDNKGLQLVAYLVGNPDREFHVLHLTGIADGGGSGQTLFEAGAAHGPDAAARSAYQERLQDLRAELEQAESQGDLGHAERARHEIEFLTAELTRALGLGGRQREAGGSAERARVNVQRRISDALKRIESACPPLGRQLTRAIRTGTYCSCSS